MSYQLDDLPNVSSVDPDIFISPRDFVLFGACTFSYNFHLLHISVQPILVIPVRIELTTYALGVRRSCPLSYGIVARGGSLPLTLRFRTHLFIEFDVPVQPVRPLLP